MSSPNQLERLGRYGLFVLALGRRLSPPFYPRQLFVHANTLWRRCVGPVLLTMFPFGAVIGLQGMQVFDLFTAHRLLSGLLALVVARELAPVLASVLIVAQGGSAFAAELGAMKIREELDATEVMAVDALRWHVLPRVLAMTVVTPALTALAILMGIFGGYVVAIAAYGQAPGVFQAHLKSMASEADLGAALIKSLVLGLLMGLLSCYLGWSASGGAAGVGRAVNRTVVLGVLTILGANWILTLWLFG